MFEYYIPPTNPAPQVQSEQARSQKRSGSKDRLDEDESDKINKQLKETMAKVESAISLQIASYIQIAVQAQEQGNKDLAEHNYLRAKNAASVFLSAREREFFFQNDNVRGMLVSVHIILGEYGKAVQLREDLDDRLLEEINLLDEGQVKDWLRQRYNANLDSLKQLLAFVLKRLPKNQKAIYQQKLKEVKRRLDRENNHR